ncbi:helix-turn-helix domain-containing protein [Arthrobacter sp. EH-1B-1]|uniref:Helix-turn-helix domain-containing protein n=1 Tax=Arthrobacter vasquezii TaxID=2977629 RepID=A0ABT6CQZ6_9MICC|nr:helix-turn-helix domain-containing protein [Arthrobacter vasquezii]MDF9276498.1 helix-turn-helix domain-containing protein [Arthrobacter vasquezii]
MSHSVVPGRTKGDSVFGGVDDADSRRAVDERTRDKVLSAVLEHGPVSAAELGDRLGFTPAAVRRHLDALSRDGLIEVKVIGSPSAGAGRPARRYVLSQRGQTRLGNDYLHIAQAALGQLREIAGPDAVRQFAAGRFADMEERYRPVIESAGDRLEDKAAALAEALSLDGFVGSTREIGRNAPHAAMLSVQLCQGHCPIQELAADFPDFCEQETDVFARLLGVDVRRLSTLAAGGHVCTTHIPIGRIARAGETARQSPESDAPAPHPYVTNVSNHQQGRP